MGELSSTQVNNRRGLRQLMRQAGFIQLPSEWWHYNAAPSDSVHAAMAILGK
jgi:D-alanyl-D-alanine dipeptidase